MIAALYPPDGEGQAGHDFAVARWGSERGLPIPRALAHRGSVVVSEDLGDQDVGSALRRRDHEDEVLAGVLAALEDFQRCPWNDFGTPPFDAEFFRRELSIFEEFARCGRLGADVSRFLDGLSRSLVAHPFRLAHRDFHVNNLFWRHGRVWAVDFQDMRGGPDTYDAVSLLRERAGARLLAGHERWLTDAAARLDWSPGWQERLLTCAAQRGLKVIGTFLRLIAQGKPSYASFLPDVRRNTLDALRALAAPPELLDATSSCPSPATSREESR